MCITGYSTDGKQRSQAVEKHRAFPQPANTVSHSSIIRPVIHIATVPTTTAKIHPYLSYIKKENIKSNKKEWKHTVVFVIQFTTMTSKVTLDIWDMM